MMAICFSSSVQTIAVRRRRDREIAARIQEVGASTGTKIGTAVSQKLGFWEATPVVQPSGAERAGVTLGNVDGEIRRAYDLRSTDPG